MIGLLLFSLLAIGVVSCSFGTSCFATSDQPPFANTEELFKYGSIGNENNSGLPYWIWLVLPKMFPQYLPGVGAYSSFGFSWEPGQPLRWGSLIRRSVFPELPSIVLFVIRRVTGWSGRAAGAGGGRSRAYRRYSAYQSFLPPHREGREIRCERHLAEIGLIYDLSWLDRLSVPFCDYSDGPKSHAPVWRITELDGRTGRGWCGPTRVGAREDQSVQPGQFGILEMNTDITIGNSVMVPLWNMLPSG